MNLSEFKEKLLELLKDVAARATPNEAYTKGYMDALRYCVDWIEETE